MGRECKHEKKLEVYGKCNDSFSWNYNDNGWSDPNYAPNIHGLCGEDDIEFTLCLNCLQVIGIDIEEIEVLIEEFKEEELDDLNKDPDDENIEWDNDY